MKLSRSVAIVAVWYFLAYGNSAGMAQVGPFSTQAACEHYRALTVEDFPTLVCFSTTAKQ